MSGCNVGCSSGVDPDTSTGCNVGCSSGVDPDSSTLMLVVVPVSILVHVLIVLVLVAGMVCNVTDQVVY